MTTLTASPFARDYADLLNRESRIDLLVEQLRDSIGRTDREVVQVLSRGATKFRTAAHRHLFRAGIARDAATCTAERAKAKMLCELARLFEDATLATIDAERENEHD